LVVKAVFKREVSIANLQANSDTRLRVFSSLSWLFLARIIHASSSLVYLAALTRSLSLEMFGSFSLIIAAAQLVYGFTAFNTWQVIVQYGTGHKVGGDHLALSRLTLFCLSLEIMTALIGIFIVLMFYPLVTERFGMLGGLETAALLFILFFLLCFRSTAVGLLRIGEFFREGTIAEAYMPAIRMVGAVIVAFTTQDIIDFLIVWALAEFAIAAVHWYLALNRTKLMLWQNPISAVKRVLQEEKGIFRFSLFVSFGNVLSTANQQLVVVLTGAWLGPVAAGLFRIGYQLGKALAGLFDIISRTLFTEFNRMHADNRSDDVQILVRKTNMMAVVGGGILVGLLYLFGEELVILLAGEKYVGAYAAIVIMALAAVIDLVCTTYQASLTANGRAGSALMVRLLSTALLLVFLYPLIAMYGADGPALAILASTILAYIGFRYAMRLMLKKVAA